MDINKELAQYNGLAEAEIEKYINRDIPELYTPLKDLMGRGGKRLRPAMCMMACEAVGGKKKDAVTAAACIEMIHNFTLIHDDIADRSELRRGKPCLHKTYGLGLAINAGDGLFSLAYEALADAMRPLDAPSSKELLRRVASAVTLVSEGQALDIAWVERKEWGLGEADYFKMIRRKTGALMEAACAVGALVGGGAPKQVKALGDFGMGLGVGFQIHDDVLNLRADVKKYGKEIGGDINEGKRTLMVIYTLNACTAAERKLLVHMLDKEKNSEDEIKSAIEIINRYGSIERAAEEAKRIVEEAKKGLGAIPENKAKELLLGIADYMIERDL